MSAPKMTKHLLPPETAEEAAAPGPPTPASTSWEGWLPDGWFADGAPPLTVDIGCHRGTFLVEMARTHPGENFLGIEKLGERAAKTRKKLERLGLANATVAHGDARAILSGLPDGCLHSMHALFPDPWPKRRHERRRLISPEFLSDARRLLVPGGLLRILTDAPPYAAAIANLIKSCPAFQMVGAENFPAFPPTEFQKKFREAGVPVFATLAHKVQ